MIKASLVFDLCVGKYPTEASRAAESPAEYPMSNERFCEKRQLWVSVLHTAPRIDAERERGRAGVIIHPLNITQS